MARRGRERSLEKERLYWDLLASGLGTVEACRQVGIARRTGLRWHRENGGFRAHHNCGCSGCDVVGGDDRRVGERVGVEVSRGWEFSHCPSGRPRLA